MAKELNFTLEGVQGDLKLKYGPFNQRLYQDGREIKKQGRFNPKYYVINTNGEKEEIKGLEKAITVLTYVTMEMGRSNEKGR